MGASQSISEGKAPSRGLHVLRVTPSSPASQTDIEPFFDFIIGYEDAGRPMQKADIEAHDFEKVVEEHEGTRLDLIVWSSKSQSIRHVPIIPSREWSRPHKEDEAAGNASSQPSLLGLSMRICEPEFSLDNVWHVLDVLEGSPAESAGLVPYGDWIIGWSGGVLRAEGDFYDVVEAHEDKPLRVYVYSYDFDTIREVVLVPNRQWGGEGLLGCVFGYGLLHRIPAPDTTEHSDMQYDDGATFVPAESETLSDGRTRPVADDGVDFEDGRSGRVGSKASSSARPGASSYDDQSRSTPHYLDPPLRRES